MHPHARVLLRAGSLVFHCVCGGMTVVCLRYAVVLSDNTHLVHYLLHHALIFGALAVTISYLQGRYLDA
jgi:hypothetical protein